MNVLEFKNVSYQREGMNSPLKDVNFTIKQGDLVHLQGDNGAGKSTIIDFILGIREPDSGEITIFGESPTDLKHKLKTGAVIQNLTFPSNVNSFKKWIDLIESHYPKAKEKVNSALQKLENEDLNQNKDDGKFSGGQLSKIFFALAQAGDPDFLILDEPTNSLTFENRQKIWQQIQEFTEQGKTVLWFSQFYYAKLSGKCQNNNALLAKFSKTLNPKPFLFITFNLLLIPSTIP